MILWSEIPNCHVTLHLIYTQYYNHKVFFIFYPIFFFAMWIEIINFWTFMFLRCLWTPTISIESYFWCLWLKFFLEIQQLNIFFSKCNFIYLSFYWKLCVKIASVTRALRHIFWHSCMFSLHCLTLGRLYDTITTIQNITMMMALRLFNIQIVACGAFLPQVKTTEH